MAESKAKIHYIEGIGRRKTAVARVRITPVSRKASETEVVVNDRALEKYFPSATHRRTVLSPFERLDLVGAFKVSAHVNGGGIAAQVEAIRHGVSRALIEHNPDFKKLLKPFGFLTRDPRMVERKKYGLKKARRAPQWSKR